MKFFSHESASFALLLVAAAINRVAADLTVTVKPVRYCSSTGWFGICTGHSYPWGNFWENAGVSGNDQDKIFMAYMATPPSPSAVKNIVFLSSGQQGSSGGDAQNNVVSGYKAGYSWDTKLNGQKSRSLDGRSLAVRFKDENLADFSPSDTVFVTVANSMFNHMLWSSTKSKFLTAFTNFLGSHVSSWSNVEKIYLAGSSRGGCLVSRLAKKLMDDSSIDVANAKFTVHVVDGVCKYTQNEYGTTSDTIDNPNSPNSAFQNYKGRKTDISSQIATAANKRQMCMRHVVGGEEVTQLALGVRAFTHDTCTSSAGCTLTDSNGDEYYKQTWHDITHTDFGRNYAFDHVTVENFLDHYQTACKPKFAPPPPPTPTNLPTPRPKVIYDKYPAVRLATP